MARALHHQLRVVRALVLRDMITRYGRENIGFVWLVLEPMLLCSGVLVLWSYMHPEGEHGIPVAAIVLTGYMPLTLWRHLVFLGIALIRRNMSVLYHARITALDVVLSRLALEILAVTGAALVIFCTLKFANIVEWPVDARRVLVGWMLMAWFAGSVGLIVTALTEYTEILDKFVQPFMYLTIPLSGCFFLLDWLPTYARDLILYFPLPHGYELIRGGYFGDIVTTYGSVPYLTCWSAGLTAVGLSLMQVVRTRVSFTS